MFEPRSVILVCKIMHVCFLYFWNIDLKRGESCAGNERKVKNLLELPNASAHLSLWKADLTEESSYDDAVQGCHGVFHVATPMELLYHDEPAEVCIH